MALDFPNNPTVGDKFASEEAGRRWKWNGTVWELDGFTSLSKTAVTTDGTPIALTATPVDIPGLAVNVQAGATNRIMVSVNIYAQTTSGVLLLVVNVSGVEAGRFALSTSPAATGRFSMAMPVPATLFGVEVPVKLQAVTTGVASILRANASFQQGAMTCIPT